jgi:predicted MPP superfamily phosphohydrolase
MTAFSWASLATWLFIIGNARLSRGRLFAIFATVIVGIYTLSAVAIAPLGRATPLWPLLIALHSIVYIHLFWLARPRMRPLWYRSLVSIPASFFMAGTVLALPWGIALRLGFSPWLPWLPYALALGGLWQSLRSPQHDVHIVLDDRDVTGLVRYRPQGQRASRPLRIVQISDPHLGPFMSVERLQQICHRAVAADPDLVLLTGDFLTMESQDSVSHLQQALSPLTALRGRTFACHGNHDHEAPQIVSAALAACGIALLVDDATTASTAWGEVDLIGFDYVRRDRSEHLRRVTAAHPRRSRRLRLGLLHDPGAFRHLPPGTTDLVFSGHTHGGQLGLLSLGGSWTFPRLIDMPDHGLWARGHDRLYVHRGTGHYGFPLRVGVPAEESILHIHVPT